MSRISAAIHYIVCTLINIHTSLLNCSPTVHSGGVDGERIIPRAGSQERFENLKSCVFVMWSCNSGISRIWFFKVSRHVGSRKVTKK